jgi:uncharacterized membrane protein
MMHGRLSRSGRSSRIVSIATDRTQLLRRPWSLFILLVVIGPLIVALAIPLAHRRVPPNRWYGIRLPSTLADEELWYAANARAGRDMIIVGAVVTLLALAAPLALPHWPPELRTLLVAIVLVVGSMIATVRAVRHVGRLRRDRGVPS